MAKKIKASFLRRLHYWGDRAGTLTVTLKISLFRAFVLGLILSLVLFAFEHRAHALMSASSCKSKIMADYASRTGQTMTDGTFNTLVDICQGIIDEITADAELTVAICAAGIPVSTTGTATAQTGSTTAAGVVTGKVK